MCISNAMKMRTPMDDQYNQNARAAQEQAAQRNASYAQSAYQDPNVGISGLLRRATQEENEGCAILAESHGFPELARHIRMRISTPDPTPKDG